MLFFFFFFFSSFFFFAASAICSPPLHTWVELARTVGREAFAVFQDSLGLDWEDNRLERASENAHKTI